MIAKIYEDNIWDKQRVIDACLEICDGNGLLPLPQNVKDYDSWSLRTRRLIAVLKSQKIDYEDLTKEMKLNFSEPSWKWNLSGCSGIIHLVSQSISDQTIEDLYEFLQDYDYEMEVFHIDFHDYVRRCWLFEGLFKYKISATELRKYRAHNRESKFIFQITRGVFQNFIQTGVDYIDNILKLLMGDNFAQPITVKELIEKFDYPKISDDELQDIDIENYYI
ncbi:MAG: hypothetical protein IKP73_15840 [Bacteroidales bacterium]|nr:hypothetical protein [Bacteroidales bacterium]